MSDWWFTLLTLAFGVVCGVVAGFRWGYRAGYDEAEQICYEHLRARDKEKYLRDD